MPSKNPPNPIPSKSPAQITRRHGEPDTSGGRRRLHLRLNHLLVVDEEPVTFAPDDGEDDEVTRLLTVGGYESPDAPIFQHTRIQDPTEADLSRLLDRRR